MIRFDKRNKRWRWEFDRYVDDGNGKAPRIRKSRLLPHGTSEQEAQAISAKLEAELFVKSSLVAQSDEWEAYVHGLLTDRLSWLHQQVTRTKHRAKVSEKAGNLTAREIADLLLRSRGRCEVTGIKFQIGGPARARARPFFHSIDRIDCARGYEAWNCRMVCFAVNVAMNNWGQEVFAKLATGFVVNQYCAVGILSAGGWSNFPQPVPRIKVASAVDEIA